MDGPVITAIRNERTIHARLAVLGERLAGHVLPPRRLQPPLSAARRAFDVEG